MTATSLSDQFALTCSTLSLICVVVAGVIRLLHIRMLQRYDEADRLFEFKRANGSLWRAYPTAASARGSRGTRKI